MNESILQTQLEQAAASAYPLHMPGHKRQVCPAPGLAGCFGWDTTETISTDDLHGAQGILAEAMARTAALWGAQRTWYLVNGSTCGLLAAIRSVTRRGGSIIAARNCHKAVYHAIELGGLTVRWLTPPVDPSFGVYGSVTPAMVADALADAPDAACVVLTSPTFEGVLSDIRTIAGLCHSRGIPLIVDEAHGAHFLPMAAPYGWQGGAVASGADLVIHSAHKTLPSLTQTALLHKNGSLVDETEVERQLNIFESSSPSYPLMVSLDGCTGQLAAHGSAWFAAWQGRLQRFSSAAADWKNIRALCHGTDTPEDHPGFFAFDRSKITLDIGQEGGACLRAHGFEPEMICGENLMAMTSPCDAEDALDRLADVLTGLDARRTPPALRQAVTLPPPGNAVCTIADALELGREEIPLRQAEGRVAAEYVWAYPPGVPLVAPGETITAGFLTACAALEASGTHLRHTGCRAPGRIRVVT